MYEGKSIVSPPGFREDPRFICRREGHDPELVVTTSSIPLESIVARCKRCRQLIEVPYQESKGAS